MSKILKENLPKFLKLKNFYVFFCIVCFLIIMPTIKGIKSKKIIYFRVRKIKFFEKSHGITPCDPTSLNFIFYTSRSALITPKARIITISRMVYMTPIMTMEVT